MYVLVGINDYQLAVFTYTTTCKTAAQSTLRVAAIDECAGISSKRYIELYVLNTS